MNRFEDSINFLIPEATELQIIKNCIDSAIVFLPRANQVPVIP